MSETTAPIGLFDRAIRRITGVWRDMAAGVTEESDDSIQAQMRACLNARGGDVSARNRAAKLAQEYLLLDEAGRTAFLRTLSQFDTDPAALASGYDRLQATNDPAERATATVGQAERKAIYDKLQEILLDDVPFAPIFAYEVPCGVGPRIHGYVAHPYTACNSWNNSEWSVG